MLHRSQQASSALTLFGLTIACCSVAIIAQAEEASTTFAAPPVTWDSIDGRMRWEADHGFSGVVLVTRDGEVVFHKGFGMANREKQIAMRPDTILSIGSTPIDFTQAGVLLLAERGKLSLSDPIAKYLDSVPLDKQTIAINHLMTGRSGLRDFHDEPSDPDPNFSWIDRDEAVRRILSQKLLFEPGKGQKHSHSAWGLLAAIIEIVSGQTYPEFAREHLFKPAGMNDTGFCGEPHDDERMAIGYGPRSFGKANAPPYWGKTSWLVMGSGGMISTAEDLYRWNRSLLGGKILSADTVSRRYPASNDVASGGNPYGFEVIVAHNRKSFVVVMSNAASAKSMPQINKLGDDLAELIFRRSTAK